MTAKTTIALFQTGRFPNMKNNKRFVGTVERKVKELKLRCAPSYSGDGPMGPRSFNYVEIHGKRWIPSSAHMVTEDTNCEEGYTHITMKSITLRLRDKLPKDLKERPDLASSY